MFRLEVLEMIRSEDSDVVTIRMDLRDGDRIEHIGFARSFASNTEWRISGLFMDMFTRILDDASSLQRNEFLARWNMPVDPGGEVMPKPWLPPLTMEQLLEIATAPGQELVERRNGRTAERRWMCVLPRMSIRQTGVRIGGFVGYGSTASEAVYKALHERDTTERYQRIGDDPARYASSGTVHYRTEEK